MEALGGCGKHLHIPIEETKICNWYSNRTIRTKSKTSINLTTPTIPTIGSRHQAIYLWQWHHIMEVKLQECTTLSTLEANYIATLEATKEAIWLYPLSTNFSATRWIDHPTSILYCNSLSSIHLIWNPVYHAKKKHIEVRYHHIWGLVTNKKLCCETSSTIECVTQCIKPCT